MADDFIVQNIKDLPPLGEIRDGDSLIVETEQGTFLLDFENFIVPLDNTTFAATVSTNTTNIAAVSAQTESDLNTLSADLVAKIEEKEVLTLYYTAKPGRIFKARGSSVQVPFDFTHVSNITGTTDSSNFSPNACDVTIFAQTSSFVIPKGTYKVSAHASLIAKSTSVADTPLWAYLDVFQKTPPTNAHITSNIATTTAVSGAVTMFAEGFMWLCRDAEVAVRITTEGSTTFESFHAGTSGFPIQINLERISSSNTLSPRSIGRTT